MQTNIGKVERIVRLVIGGMILGLYGALSGPWNYLTLVGLIPVGTALTGYCPLYAMIGRNTNR